MSGSYHIALDCIDKHALSWINKNKIALIAVQEGRDTPTKLTYSQLMGLTNRMANALRSLGIKKSERILLRLPNGPEFPVSFLGAMKLGALPVPSSPLYTWRELKYLLEDSEAVALVATEKNLPTEVWTQRPSFLKKIILVSEKDNALPHDALRWQNILKSADANFQTILTNAEAPAFLLYTSGTIGEPKAAVHAHRSIRAHDPRCRIWLDVKESDVIFNTSSLNWSYALTAGLLDIWRYGLTGVTYEGDPTAENISQIVKRFAVSIFMSVPGLYRRLAPYLQEHPEVFSKVRLCLSAGENLCQETREKFSQALGLEIFEGLGMTENSVYLAQPSKEKPVKDSLGRTLFANQIKILREDLTEAPPGETGILSTHKDCLGLMLGYYEKNPEPHLPLQGEWFLSGDLAHTDEAGNFFFDGRSDDVITAGGYRISPLEVEQVLNQHPAVEESAVTGKREGDKTWVEAYVVLKIKEDATPNLEKEIKNFSEKSLAAFKIPRRIHWADHLPKTVTGKIKRSLLTSGKT